MDLDTIHHVALNVGDYGRAKEFYVNLLGFQILWEYQFPSGTRRMDCSMGQIRLELFHTKKATAPPSEYRIGYRHLCFRVCDIHKIKAELESRGISVEPIRPDPMAGGLMTFFHDPDGATIELHE